MDLPCKLNLKRNSCHFWVLTRDPYENLRTFIEHFLDIFFCHIPWNFLFFGTFSGHFLEQVKLGKFTSSFCLWNFLLFARVKLGKNTSLLNTSLGTFTILENLLCIQLVLFLRSTQDTNLCHSWVLFGGLMADFLTLCLTRSGQLKSLWPGASFDRVPSLTGCQLWPADIKWFI